MGAKVVRRAVYGAFIILVAAFVISNIAQVAVALFFQDDASPKARASAPCAAEVREGYRVMNEALAVGLGTSDADEAGERYRAARDASWTRKGALEQACAQEPGNLESMAALARFDKSAEGAARRQARDLAAVRRDVESSIR